MSRSPIRTRVTHLLFASGFVPEEYCGTSCRMCRAFLPNTLQVGNRTSISQDKCYNPRTIVALLKDGSLSGIGSKSGTRGGINATHDVWHT